MRLNQIVQANHQALNERIVSGDFELDPSSAASVLNALRRINALLFADVPIAGLGRMREGTESVSLDYGNNAFQGVPPGEINAQLTSLWNCTREVLPVEGNVPLESLAIALGFFLVGFFAIHPFSDGNGRTARLMMRLVAGRYGADLRPLKLGAAARREYIDSLRRAHRLRLKDGRLTIPMVRYVARFIRKHLVSQGPAIVEEVAPAADRL